MKAATIMNTTVKRFYYSHADSRSDGNNDENYNVIIMLKNKNDMIVKGKYIFKSRGLKLDTTTLRKKITE